VSRRRRVVDVMVGLVSRLCFARERDIANAGIVSSSASSTFSVVGQGEFNISYVDGTGAAGDYFTDVFGIGGVKVTGLEMGLASSGKIGQGIMGIGYNSSEANVETGNGTVYANLPNKMLSEGLISSLAYSLWLNDLRRFTFSGAILQS